MKKRSIVQKLFAIAAAAALCWLAWTVGRPAPEPPPPGQSLPEEKSPAPLPEQDPSSPAETYDFTRPAPERAPVDNSYFQNAAFVGDSRTDGFLIYSGIGTGKNLTSNGLSIFKLEEKKALRLCRRYSKKQRQGVWGSGCCV